MHDNSKHGHMSETLTRVVFQLRISFYLHPSDTTFAFNMTKFAARIRMNDTTNPVLLSKEADLKQVHKLRSGRLMGLVTVDTSVTLLTDTVGAVLCVM